MPYHVRLTPADRQRSAHDELALDLTREELERRFLTPRLENRPVTVSGRTLAWEQIERIRINETTESSEQLLPRIHAAQAADPIVVVGISEQWLVTEEGREVTDELITEPVGSAATPAAPPSPGVWFHVRGERGLVRQAHEFNLSERELVQRFVDPWRAGEQVVVDGKGFAPTEARLRIYVGPRLSTGQRAMGQGWLNATQTGEDATSEYLGARAQPETRRGHVSGEAERDPRAVAVAHGRDEPARRAIFGFLQDLGLTPLDWGSLRARTGHTNPYTGDVVELAFQVAQAVVVLFTPDDEARLHPELAGEDEPEHEQLTGQPRSNVILEAGMALISHPDRTIIVELGHLRPISNLAGRNTVRITGNDIPATLNELASRLETAHCPVNRNATDWLDTQRFAQLTALTRRASTGVSNASPAQVDDLLLEVRAAAERADVSLPVSHHQDVVAFLRDRREPFDSAALADSLPAPRLLQRDAKRLVVELDRAGLLQRNPAGGRGWLLTGQ